MTSDAGPGRLARQVIEVLTARGQSIAAAESLTGGLVAAALTSVPGSSAAFRGGVIAYATDLKASLLGVPAGLLEHRGAVDPAVATAMADGVRMRLGASVGVSTTGVAGPDPADGRPVGTVYIAVATAAGSAASELALGGSRGRVRDETVSSALSLVLDWLQEEGN
jgi:nicotinamide-nucleotide amidase